MKAKTKKVRIANIAIVVIAWAIAIMLVYSVYLKYQITHH